MVEVEVEGTSEAKRATDRFFRWKRASSPLFFLSFAGSFLSFPRAGIARSCSSPSHESKRGSNERGGAGGKGGFILFLFLAPWARQEAERAKER